MNSQEINELIWGELETKVGEIKIPLSEITPRMKERVSEGATMLFTGFFIFFMYKLGYKYGDWDFEDDPELEEEIKKISWWVRGLESRQFIDKIRKTDESKDNTPITTYLDFSNEFGEKINFVVIFNWFAFIEANLALHKTINEKSDVNEIAEEFVFLNENSKEMIENLDIYAYYSNISSKEHGEEPKGKFLLRPDKLAELINQFSIKDHNDMFDFPEYVFSKYEWDLSKSGQISRTFEKEELIYCNENNFRELLDKLDINLPSINFPNSEFSSFSEFIQENEVSKIDEWKEIRDRYISKLAESIKKPYLSKNFDMVDEFLQKSKTSIKEKKFVECIVFSSNAIENGLTIFLKESDSLNNLIRKLQSHKELSDHIPNLNYIKKIRNLTTHPDPFTITENIANTCLEWTELFVESIKKEL